MIAHKSSAGHSQTLASHHRVDLIRAFVGLVLVVEDGQRPAPADEFTGDRRVSQVPHRATPAEQLGSTITPNRHCQITLDTPQ
jgi:hypothetical protein